MPDFTQRLSNGVRVYYLEETGSTNSDALELARHGESGPLWVLAKRQTKGRGRSGRQWQSANSKNLYATFLTTLTCPADVAAQLALVAGVAVAESALHFGGEKFVGTDDVLTVKWPNDLLVGRRKLAGVLIESTVSQSSGDLSVAMGFGVNTSEAPSELKETAVSLADMGVVVEDWTFLDRLACDVARWLEVWDQGNDFASVRMRWLDLACAIGEPIRVHGVDGVVTGRFGGLDETGALKLVEGDGNIRVIRHGDVAFVDGWTIKDG